MSALRGDADEDIDLDDAGMGTGRRKYRSPDQDYEGDFDLPPPRRRYRSDDRAFNESLSRAGRRADGHADEIDGEYEVVDEPRRGREPR